MKKIKNVLYYVGEEITDLLLGAPGCGPPIGLIIALSIVAMIVFAILK